jgi:hypothetical protein
LNDSILWFLVFNSGGAVLLWVCKDMRVAPQGHYCEEFHLKEDRDPMIQRQQRKYRD